MYIFTSVDAFMTKTQFSDAYIKLGGGDVFITKKTTKRANISDACVKVGK